MGEVINWEEKYVSYVEGDLRRDIQDLKDGQKALDAKIGNLDAKIENGLKALDAKIDTKINDLRKELGDKIDRMTYIIIGAFAVALIGGLIKLFIG